MDIIPPFLGRISSIDFGAFERACEGMMPAGLFRFGWGGPLRADHTADNVITRQVG